MNKRLITLLLLMLPIMPVQASGGVGMFGQGATQFSLIAGSGTAFNNDYLIFGAGINYYISDGVGVGLSYENWSGNTPGINQTTPSIEYVFYRSYPLQPYVGGFYRHTAIANQTSMNSVGGRAGFYFSAGPRSVFGFGLTYESFINCQPAVFGACSESYPEISLIFGF